MKGSRGMENENVTNLEMFKLDKEKKKLEEKGWGTYHPCAFKCEDGTEIYKELTFKEAAAIRGEIVRNGKVEYTDKNGDSHYLMDILVLYGFKYHSLINEGKG